MLLQLNSCGAKRPDKRAIAKALVEYASGMDSGLARELTDILLDGSPVEIEVADGVSSSGLRAMRKLDIDYEIKE